MGQRVVRLSNDEHAPATKVLAAHDLHALPAPRMERIVDRRFGRLVSGSMGLFQLVSRRYERGSILITSNRSVGEWGEVFGDAVVATAILDRLLHHSHVLMITGESFRLREKRRAGVLRLSAPTPHDRPQKTT